MLGVRLGICSPICTPDFSKIYDFMRKYDRIHDFEKSSIKPVKSRLETIERI